MSLDCLHIRDEVSFDFPAGAILEAGERAQIVAKAAVFVDCYSGAPVRVLGEYTGSLANEGGRLHLLSDITGTIRDFFTMTNLPGRLNPTVTDLLLC